MEFLFLCLLFSSLGFRRLTEANSTYSPRMIFKCEETAVKRIPLPGQNAHVRILPNGQLDVVKGQTLYSYNFQHPQMNPVESKVSWKKCFDRNQQACNYNITVVHETQDVNKVFVCGNNGKETLCCEMNLSDTSPICNPTKKTEDIERSLSGLTLKEGEPSAFVESADGADLYMTFSGSQEHVGIRKFGKDPVRPHDSKEQHYVGLMLSRRSNDSLQDKVYAFYKEKNRDSGLQSDMWLPFVTQVCMADTGGPKNKMQSSWTSQTNAKLFCGDADSRQHFSELVDVATVHANQWQDTRVYALFRNEWGMSAVCVYTIRDIDNIFTTSPFKGTQKDRPRTCVTDSTKISLDTLNIIADTSEMEQWVKPVSKSGPLLFNRHKYTHIYADSTQHKGNDNYMVLFLSLNNGGIHKVLQTENHTFVIAEYHPFTQQTHILSIILHPSSRKLYVNSRDEIVQLDVANCAKYGDSCEDCILARDPYCGWNGTHCTPDTQDTLQNVATGNHTICEAQPKKAFRHSSHTHANNNMDSITLPSQSKYFLQCPLSSHHAQYTWRHSGNPESPISCTVKDEECLLLIHNMLPEQVGTYECKSEELGYERVVAQYSLQLKSRAAGRLSSPLVWVCLMAALIKSLTC
ncbi:semaphorin-7A-like [Toxotes jaculatrix]|uniref:semaphorin-7A-like n=1 Tax=Toxotes jaculatrix TaxID=941984 RepID=UPI001B3AB166|nr:semaphorin-7A-like [Toxotes jaculatrix]